MTTIDDLEALRRVSAGFERACESVTASALDSATPCANWNVTDLLDHVTGGNRFTVAVLGGATAEQALADVRTSFNKDHEPVQAAVASLAPQLDSFAIPSVLDQRCHHVAGVLTGRQILRLRIHDMNIHTWDLNQAVNPRAGLDASVARWAIAELAMSDSLASRHMAMHLDRPPTTAFELLGSFGRRRARRAPNHH